MSECISGGGSYRTQAILDRDFLLDEQVSQTEYLSNLSLSSEKQIDSEFDWAELYSDVR